MREEMVKIKDWKGLTPRQVSEFNEAFSAISWPILASVP